MRSGCWRGSCGARAALKNTCARVACFVVVSCLLAPVGARGGFASLCFGRSTLQWASRGSLLSLFLSCMSGRGTEVRIWILQDQKPATYVVSHVAEHVRAHHVSSASFGPSFHQSVPSCTITLPCGSYALLQFPYHVG